MRSLLLASAAVLMSAGLACAQVPSSGPAPTGNPAHATVPTQPGMSPGNEGSSGPASSGMMQPMTKTDTPTATPLSASGSSGTTHTPPMQNTGSSPDMMPSGGASSGGMSSSSNAKPRMMRHHMYMSHSMMSMPANAGATDYLKAAQMAVKHHNKMMADDMLSHAETRMLDRAVPAGGIAAASSPGISSIEDARKSVASGDMMAASKSIDMAMSQAQ